MNSFPFLHGRGRVSPRAAGADRGSLERRSTWKRLLPATCRVSVEQGQVDRAEAAAEAQGNLGHPIRLQPGARTRNLAVMQQKTQRPVQFEITEQTRESVEVWIKVAGLLPSDFLFPGRIHASPHLSTRQHARIVHGWIRSFGLDDDAYGTHTMRRTKASLIHRRTKKLRAVQLLFGHSKLESTVRYVGIEVDDPLEMAEQTEV